MPLVVHKRRWHRWQRGRLYVVSRAALGFVFPTTSSHPLPPSLPPSDALYQTPTAITSSSIDCTVPSRVISSGTNAGDTLPLGATVWVVIQTWNTGEPNPQSVDCFSHEGQSYGSWSAGDSVTVQYSNTVANACNPVPTISGVLPTVGVNPGDTVTISGSFHANARCLWWWNQNACT